VFNGFAKFYFRFTELEDDLRDGCITLKVCLLLLFLNALCRNSVAVMRTH